MRGRVRIRGRVRGRVRVRVRGRGRARVSSTSWPHAAKTAIAVKPRFAPTCGIKG